MVGFVLLFNGGLKKPRFEIQLNFSCRSLTVREGGTQEKRSRFEIQLNFSCRSLSVREGGTQEERSRFEIRDSVELLLSFSLCKGRGGRRKRRDRDSRFS